MVLTFNSVYEISKFDYSNKSYKSPAVLFIMLYKVILTFESVNEIPESLAIQIRKLLRSTFLCIRYRLLHCTEWYKVQRPLVRNFFHHWLHLNVNRALLEEDKIK